MTFIYYPDLNDWWINVTNATIVTWLQSLTNKND